MTEQTMVPELDANWRFLAAYADALQRDGTSAHEVERALRRRADALEVPVRIVAAPTLILLSIGPEQAPWTVLLPAELGQLDISRHERVERIADAVEARRMPAASGLAALQRPVVPLYDRATRALATIVLCGAAAPLFGGGVYAVLAAAIGGMALLLVLESPVLREIRVPLAALAGTAGSLSASQFLQIDATAPLLGSLILLMPGFTATVATAELATGNLLSGMARIAGAAATLVQIGLGMAVATRLLGPSEVVGIDPAVPVVASIAATSLAFTVVLGARAQLGPWIALSVLVAWAGSTLGTAYLGPYPGAAAAAWLVGMTGSLWGRWHHKPAALLTVPGLLLLVPGSIGFRGVVSALTGDVVVGMDLLLQMGVTAFALATGLLAAGVPTNPRLSAPRTAGSLGTGPAGSPRSMPAPRDGSGGPAPVPQH